VRSDRPWRDAVRESGGVDVVCDPVGGDRFVDSLRALREDGRLVVLGFTAGSIPEVKVNRLLLGNTSVVGAYWGGYVLGKPELNREIGAAVAELIAGGSVRPLVGARFPLERGSEALALLEERGATGKVVLEV
jgi:NADPH2:quinone reductase